MDVEMPDGTVIEGVPEGTTQAQLTSMLAQQRVRSAVNNGKRQMAQDMPWHEAALIGMGKGGDTMAAGGKQIGIGIAGQLAKLLPAGMRDRAEEFLTGKAGELDRQQQSNAAEYAHLANERPFATGAGEGASMFVVPGAVGGGALKTIAGAALQGAVPGMLEYGDMGDRLKRGAMGAAGGAAGGTLGVGLGRAAQPFRAAASETRDAAIAAAKELGVTLTPAEITGSRALKWSQAALDDLPIAGAIGTARRSGNAQALNRAALKDIGENGVEITDKVLSGARSKIGGKYEDAFKAERVQLFDGTVNKLGQIEDEALRFLPPDQARVVSARIQEVIGKVEQDGALPGLAYQKWRASAKSANGDINHYLKQVKGAVDEAASASIATDKMALFNEANKQYASLKTLETGNVVDRATGNVMPKQLDNALASRYKDAYREGKLTGELPKVAKAGSLLREMPQSGTAPRLAYTGGGAAGGVGVMSGMLDPLTFGAAALSPAVAQLAMNNPIARRYASSGLFKVTPEMEQRFIRGGNAFGAGTALSLYSR